MNATEQGLLAEALAFPGTLHNQNDMERFRQDWSDEAGGMPAAVVRPSSTEEVAKIKRMPVDDVTHQLTANTCRLFDLMWT